MVRHFLLRVLADQKLSLAKCLAHKKGMEGGREACRRQLAIQVSIKQKLSLQK